MLVPTPQKTFRLESDPTLPAFFNQQIILQNFLERIFIEIKNQSIAQMTEYMYVVSGAPLDQIPRLVVAAFSYTPNSIDDRQYISALAQRQLTLIQKSGTPRLNPEEIAEELKTHVQGLNQIRAAILDGKADYSDYALHLNYVFSHPTGRLLTAPPLNRQINLVKEIEQMNAELVLDVSGGEVRRAHQLYFAQFRAYWATSQSMWKKTIVQADMREFYFMLSRFIESTPQAIVSTLKKYPQFKSELCWILGEMDSTIFSDRWQKGFQSIWNKISIPMWVVGVAVIPVLASGAPLLIMYAGITVLQVAGAVEIHDTYKHMNGLKQYRHFHENMTTSGLGSGYSTYKALKIDKDIQKDLNKIGASVALEIASIGVAKVASKVTHNAVAKLSRTQIAEKFYRYTLGKNPNSSLALQYRLSRTQTMEQYIDKLAIQKIPLKGRNLQREWIHDTVNRMSKNQLDGVLFESRNYGFGRTLFLTEAATALTVQTYDIATSEYFVDIKPWNYLFPQTN